MQNQKSFIFFFLLLLIFFLRFNSASCSYFSVPTAYSLWNTNVTSTNVDVTGPINFSGEFQLLYSDPSRTSWILNTPYLLRVSYRPQIGYIRVWAKDPNGVVVQDTGDMYVPQVVSNVCFLSYLFSMTMFLPLVYS